MLTRILTLCLFVASYLHAADADYFPIKYDRKLTYDVVKKRTYQLPNGERQETLTGAITEQVSANDSHLELVPKDQGPSHIYKQVINEKSETTGQSNSGSVITIISKQDGLVKIHAQQPKSDKLPTTEMTAFEPPAVLLDFNKIAAKQPFDTEMVLAGLKIHSTAKTYEHVTLDSKLGKLENVLKITGEGSVSGSIPAGQPMPISDGKTNETNWFAPGIGLVKQTQVTQMTIQLPNGAAIKTTEEKTKTIRTIDKTK